MSSAWPDQSSERPEALARGLARLEKHVGGASRPASHRLESLCHLRGGNRLKACATWEAGIGWKACATDAESTPGNWAVCRGTASPCPLRVGRPAPRRGNGDALWHAFVHRVVPNAGEKEKNALPKGRKALGVRGFGTRGRGRQPAKAFFSFSPGNRLRRKKRAKAHSSPARCRPGFPHRRATTRLARQVGKSVAPEESRYGDALSKGW